MASDPPGGAWPWRPAAGGLFVTVRLTPRGGRDAVETVESLSDGRPVLRARVRAVPEGGAANAALLRLMAQACGTAMSAVRLEAGATARLKTVRIDGDAAVLAGRLAAASGC
ncbi:MAG: DUF167 family protein [Alsobacter sp.]